MLYLKLPALYPLDAAIQEYYLTAAGKEETIRQRLAEKLYARWQGLNVPFPGCANSNDYWYFVHVFAQDRHVCRNGIKYPLSFSRFQECWIEAFSDDNPEASSAVLDMLFCIAREKKGSRLDTLDFSRPTRCLSRRDSDLLLEIAGDDTLSILGFSPKKYTLTHVPLEIYLQGMDLKLWGEQPMYTHVDGYRMRDDGVLSCIFAGNFSSPNLPHIDSYFANFISRHLISRYMICGHPPPLMTML